MVPDEDEECTTFLASSCVFYMLTLLVLAILALDVGLRVIVFGWSFFKAPL